MKNLMRQFFKLTCRACKRSVHWRRMSESVALRAAEVRGWRTNVKGKDAICPACVPEKQRNECPLCDFWREADRGLRLSFICHNCGVRRGKRKEG